MSTFIRAKKAECKSLRWGNQYQFSKCLVRLWSKPFQPWVHSDFHPHRQEIVRNLKDSHDIRNPKEQLLSLKIQPKDLNLRIKRKLERRNQLILKSKRRLIQNNKINANLVANREKASKPMLMEFLKWLRKWNIEEKMKESNRIPIKIKKNRNNRPLNIRER